MNEEFLPDLTTSPQRIGLRLKGLASKTWLYTRAFVDFATSPEKDSVIPSLIVFYVLCFLDGIYNTFVAKIPTQVLEQSLTHGQYQAFVSMTIVSPVLALCGMAFRGGWAWTGAIMRLWGDTGVAGVLSTYIAAVSYTTYWGEGNFGTTWVIASCIGAYVFIVRDIRRLADRDRWEIHR